MNNWNAKEIRKSKLLVRVDLQCSARDRGPIKTFNPNSALEIGQVQTLGEEFNAKYSLGEEFNVK